MADSTNGKSGFIVFLGVFALLVAAFLVFQTRLGEAVVEGIFPAYDLIPDAVPGEWIILSRTFTHETDDASSENAIASALDKLRKQEFYRADLSINTLIGKRTLVDLKANQGLTLFFINPYLAFLPLYIFASGIIAFLFSLFFPATSSMSWIRGNLQNVFRQMDMLLRKQFDSHNLSFIEILTLAPSERENRIRSSTLPEVVISELEDFIAIGRWMRGESRNPIHPLKFYFRYHISPKYGNVIQGLVSGGAAILIFVIGLRGLKLIPPEEPSLILMSLSIEFILLIVLMINFAGSAQEERLDRVLKELEAEQRDAIGKQTDTLQQIFTGNAGGGHGAEGDTLADYEERRILDELLGLMIRQADRLKGGHGR